MPSADLPDELRNRADRIAYQCVHAAAALSAQARRTEWWERGITVTSNVLGVLALLTASIVPVSDMISQVAKDSITVLSAIILVGGPYFQMAVVRDPPSRFRDFSRYIGGYADKIIEILSDVRSARRYERLIELLRHADENLNHVRVEWPNLMDRHEHRSMR